MWNRSDIAFTIVDDISDHPVLTVAVDTPDGRLWLMAEAEEVGRSLLLLRFHIQAAAIPRLNLGLRKLRLLAELAMEAMDYDEIVIEGAVRTSGAHPGRRPRARRFARRARAQATRRDRGD
jgi:hypothetical protein